MTVAEGVSAHGLVVRARHRRNPYDYALDDTAFAELLLAAGLRRAESVWRNHSTTGTPPRGVYPRASMAFVILDPTARKWETDADVVLAAITVGDDALRFLPNAAAKAAGHRHTGRDHGDAVLVDPHLLGSGSFRYGHSTQVRGLITAASSQSTDQDLYEAGLLATDLIEAITAAHRTWEDTLGAVNWLSPDGEPAHHRYHDMVAFFSE
ncbi:hypothetical protein [Actinokineospora globicatena]|uniref:hypothetical protein n=1 Tax=Actinokineospora globicatena TaxID=103729 RepID=UPI0020A50F50|nr:hypothetical protein [Actinokineospora globicatena]MCP2302467.1 hypothetical protein [Actinokineospora globicatena]GLW75849.1 hypothetical protein Aglo01_03310 [Actinokineospora globicatena]GLW82687.1 hypothetical protein Aglo02_03280 [Actinokineospora globicatena]